MIWLFQLHQNQNPNSIRTKDPIFIESPKPRTGNPMSSSSSRSRSPSQQPPGPEEDQRKRKRMISNRESARRSRMRKQQHLDELLGQVAQLKSDNTRISMQIDAMTRRLVAADGDNAVLRAQVSELTERLRSVNSVLRFVEEFSGMDMDIQEMPDPLLNPWQLSCPAQPIMASADVFFGG